MDSAESAAENAPKNSAARLPFSSVTAFLVVAGGAFATSGPLARYARPAHPLWVACARVALAAACFLLVAPGPIFSSLRALSRRQRGQILLAGALLAGHFAAFLIGLDHTSLPSAVSLVSLEPLSVVLVAFALHGIAPSRSERAGVIVATVGALIVSRGAGAGEHRLSGDLIVLLAVILAGFYVNAARLLADALPARHYAALVYAAAALFLGAAVLVLRLAGNDLPLSVPPHSLAAMIALALVPTLIGHTAVQAAARTASPSLVALVFPAETVGGLAIGVLLLGAMPSAIEITGALVIIAGVMIAVRGQRAA